MERVPIFNGGSNFPDKWGPGVSRIVKIYFGREEVLAKHLLLVWSEYLLPVGARMAKKMLALE